MQKTWKSEATACTTCSTVYPIVDENENDALCPHCNHNDRVNDDWMFTEFVWHDDGTGAAPFILWQVTVTRISPLVWRYSSAFTRGEHMGSKQEAVQRAIDDIPEGHKYQLTTEPTLKTEICTR